MVILKSLFFNRVDIRTAGGSTTLATFTIAFGQSSSGSVAVGSTPIAGTGLADGTAAEGRIYRVGGTASGYDVDGAHSVGDTEITVATGTGTFVAGDIIRFSGHAQDYVITKDYAGGAGNISIFPALRANVANDETIALQTAAEIAGLTVGTSASHIIVSNTSILTGQDVNLESATLTHPAAVADAT